MYKVSSFESCILYIYLFFTLPRYIMDLNIIRAYNGHNTVHVIGICEFPQKKFVYPLTGHTVVYIEIRIYAIYFLSYVLAVFI